MKDIKMRSEFLSGEQYDSLDEAFDAAPWGFVIEVEGGYRAFESLVDAQTWENQK